MNIAQTEIIFSYYYYIHKFCTKNLYYTDTILKFIIYFAKIIRLVDFIQEKYIENVNN